MCSTSVNRQLYKKPTPLLKFEPLAVSEQRFKTVISDIFQLLLLKSCLYKYCHLMNNIGLYHIHLFMLQNQMLIYPKCCYFPTCSYFVLIFVDYKLFRSPLQLKQAFSIPVSLLHIFKYISPEIDLNLFTVLQTLPCQLRYIFDILKNKSW